MKSDKTINETLDVVSEAVNEELLSEIAKDQTDVMDIMMSRCPPGFTIS